MNRHLIKDNTFLRCRNSQVRKGKVLYTSYSNSVIKANTVILCLWPWICNTIRRWNMKSADEEGLFNLSKLIQFYPFVKVRIANEHMKNEMHLIAFRLSPQKYLYGTQRKMRINQFKKWHNCLGPGALNRSREQAASQPNDLLSVRLQTRGRENETSSMCAAMREKVALRTQNSREN